MKETIKFHKECLKNSEKFLQRKRAEIDRLTEQADILYRSNAFLFDQIEEAERMGKDGFDEGKFMRQIPAKKH